MIWFGCNYCGTELPEKTPSVGQKVLEEAIPEPTLGKVQWCDFCHAIWEEGLLEPFRVVEEVRKC